MKQGTWIRFSVVVCLAAFALPAFAVNEVRVACEGTESTGGGATKYQYTLTNSTSTAVLVDYFYIGTEDVVQADYTNWVAPPGFTTVGTVGTYPFLDATFLPFVFSGMGSTLLKTAHTVVPPQLGFGTQGAIAWKCINPTPGGLCDLVQGAGFTFGFDNPNSSLDAEWFVDGPNPSASFIASAIAGPQGVFTDGWVHSPGNEPTPVPDVGLWGGILLFGGLAVLLAGAIVFWVRRSV